MILLSTDPREPAARQKFIDWLGAEDASKLVTWIHETHRAQGVEFGEALVYIVEQTEISGVTFAKNLLDMATKPRHIREAEMELIAWVQPRVNNAITTVMGFRGDPTVARQVFSDFTSELEQHINRVYPGKHEATVRGAILASCSHENGAFQVRVHSLVAALDLKDPMDMFYTKAG